MDKENIEAKMDESDMKVNGEERALTVIKQSDLLNLSESLLRSRLLPSNLRRPEQVAAIILRGRELGIAPMESLTSLHVIRGKVVSSTQLMLALIYKSGLLKDIEMTRGDPAKVTMKRVDIAPHTTTFGSEDAKRVGLHRKDNYRKWPEVMYLWRAIAMCARVVFPDVIGAVYSPDELGVEIRSDVTMDSKWQLEDESEKSVIFATTEQEPIEITLTEQEQAIVTLAGQGKDEGQIAAELGIVLPVVINVLRRYYKG